MQKTKIPRQATSRTPSTREAYLRRAKNLIARYELESGDSWSDDPMKVCYWMAGLQSTWGWSTWRQYKSAMICFMEERGPIESVKFLQGLSVSKHDCAMATQTSASKAKRLPITDLQAILDALQPGKRRWDRLLGLWLVAGIITGLRPCEWECARIIEINGNLCLRVNNAKATNGRAPGGQRDIGLGRVTESAMESVQAMLDTMSEEDFTSAYEGCRCRLRCVVHRLWPRRRYYPTLYSARHQFRADIASAGRNPVEQAALMGHISTKTAESHYGHQCDGSGRSSVDPDAECVKVIERHQREKDAPVADDG